MKVLFLTDTHVRANSPSSRKDDFPAAIINKLNWVGEYIKENNIDLVLHGGDLFDRPDVAPTVIRKLVKAIKNWQIPIYLVYGNHDLYGCNPETFERTHIGILEATGIINHLSKEPIIIGNVSLTGVDSHFKLDKNGIIEDYVDVEGDSNHIKIHVVHGFLSKVKWLDYVPHTLIDNVLNTNADIILTGHEHSGFGICRRGEKVFCNPGALARVTAGVGDVNQEVKVVYIDTDKNIIDLIPLPKDIALPADEVIDRDKLVEEKKHMLQLNTFTNNLNSLQLSEEFNIYNVLNEIAKEDSVEENIVELIRSRLQNAEEEIKKGADDE